MTDDTFFAGRFKSFMAAQYGVADPKELPDSQRLEIEDAYFAGAASGFYHGFGADDAEALSANAEMKAFGKDIVERYRRAGLPLGVRRS